MYEEYGLRTLLLVGQDGQHFNPVAVGTERIHDLDPAVHLFPFAKKVEFLRPGTELAASEWSPLFRVDVACQTCHRVPEADLRARVDTIQSKTLQLMDRAAGAMTAMLDALLEARAAGASEAQLAPALALQRKATWRLDYISSENSRGFHAPQEAARILGESIDYSRQAEAAALRLRAGAAPATEGLPRDPVLGISHSADAPR